MPDCLVSLSHSFIPLTADDYIYLGANSNGLDNAQDEIVAVKEEEIYTGLQTKKGLWIT